MMRRVILGRSNESTNTVDSDLQLITLIQINANLILRTLVYEYIYFFYMLFYNEQHTHLRGKEARDQVLKYYNRDNSKEVKGTDNCDEEQIQQTRSRTALTHKGPSSRLFRRCLRKRLQ